MKGITVRPELVATGLLCVLLQPALANQRAAESIAYDNATSGLVATDAQAAIDEVATDTGLVETTVGLDGVGAIDLDYGSADITDHTFITDGTGDAEIVLPNDSIGPAELVRELLRSDTVRLGHTGLDGDDDKCMREDAIGSLANVTAGNIYLCGTPFDSTVYVTELVCGFGTKQGWDSGDNVDICLAEYDETGTVAQFSACLEFDESGGTDWAENEVRAIAINESSPSNGGQLIVVFDNLTDPGDDLVVRASCHALYYEE